MSEAEKFQLLEKVSKMDSREQERLGWFVNGMIAQSAVQRSASSPQPVQSGKEQNGKKPDASANGQISA